MEVTGKITEIFQTTQISSSFKKREFVLEYAENPQYPEYVKFECIQDKCDLLDSHKAGDKVVVSFNLKGRKWTDPQGVDKYFNTLQAWRLNNTAGSADAPEQASSPSATAPNQAPIEGMTEPSWPQSGEESDDLPF